MQKIVMPKEYKNYSYWTPSYYQLVKSMDVKILIQVTDNDYEGDSRFLVKESKRYGILIFGWGSCSGCDALEASAGDIEKITQLRDRLYNSIHWETTAKKMYKYVDEKDWSLDYSYSPEFVKQVKEYLYAR